VKDFTFGLQPILHVGAARLYLEQFVGALPDSILQCGLGLLCLRSFLICPMPMCVIVMMLMSIGVVSFLVKLSFPLLPGCPCRYFLGLASRSGLPFPCTS